MLLRGKCFLKFLGELDIIEVEDIGEKGEKKYLLKLKELYVNLFM